MTDQTRPITCEFLTVTLHNVWLTTEEIEAMRVIGSEYLLEGPHYDQRMDAAVSSVLAKLWAAVER